MTEPFGIARPKLAEELTDSVTVPRAPAQVLKHVRAELMRDERETASKLLRAEYPFVRHESAGRAYSEATLTRVFLRDHFTDRYSGAKLVFPGTLRLISIVLPEEFPQHANWKK